LADWGSEKHLPIDPACAEDDRRNRKEKVFRCIARDHKGAADFIDARNLLTTALAASGRAPGAQKTRASTI
jgi:hypothetical protein